MNNFTLHEKDCMEVFPTIPTASVDLVVTDPPYILSAGSSGHQAGKIGTWADMMNAAFWYSSWYSQVFRILKPTGSFLTFCNWRSLSVVQKALHDAGMGMASLLVWNKKQPGPGGNNGLRPYYELVALSSKENFKIRNRSTGDIWERQWQSHQGETEHPAEKPVDFVARIIQVCELSEGAVVLDPFMGSGTTGVAAMECGVDFIGIEQDARWFSVASTRVKAAQAQGARVMVRNLTPHAADAGASPAQQALSMPEVLPTPHGESTPALRR